MNSQMQSGLIMANIFLVSDTHFGHRNIIKFKSKLREGEDLRPWDDLNHMNEELISNWNETVRPRDIVYHLGDFCMNRSAIPLAGRLNGRKRLVMGNHEHGKAVEYLEHFEDVMGVKRLSGGIILSHIPLHESQKARWPAANVHGHLHEFKLEDSWYVNVSVEVRDYRPVPLETLKREFRKIT